jgi:Fe2+ transport system protein FeoA
MFPKSSGPVPLTELSVGARAQVHQANVDASTARYLCAIGLTGTCAFRLCKAGEPCIIQVRSTRIGISKHVADRILVVPLHGTT